MSFAERIASHATACTSCNLVTSVSSSSRVLFSSSNVRRFRRHVVVCCDAREGEIAATRRTAPPSTCTEPIREELVKTRYIAETLLPTRHGAFRLRGYKHSLDGGITYTEPTAIICGEIEGQSDVPVRVHDACFTSEVLGSLKCDCAEQLQLALEYIQNCGRGMVIYLQQEGRGIGLANKIAAYALQEEGLDTVDANRALGLPDDCREYTSVRNILKDLSIRSVQVMTNNPRKLDVLTQLGVKITGRIPCQVQAGEYNKGYLTAKRDRMDHLLDGSWCFWNHDGEPTQPTATMFSDGGMGLPVGIEAARGAANANPALATHTVQMDEEDDIITSSSSSSSNNMSSSSSRRKDSNRGSSSGDVSGRSSGKRQQVQVPLNGGGSFRLPGSSSSSSSPSQSSASSN